MSSIDDVMYKAARKHFKVRVVCLDGTEYTGLRAIIQEPTMKKMAFRLFALKKRECVWERTK